MKKYTDQQIIEKAFSKIENESQNNQDVIDIAVDFEDGHQKTHSYVVTFKKDEYSKMGSFSNQRNKHLVATYRNTIPKTTH